MTTPAHRTFVYFAKGGKSGLIKIGYSADPDKRCLNFSDRKQQGEAGKVLFAVPGGRAEEANFHDQFDEYRIRGEWFVCKGQLAAFIKEGRKIHKKWRTQIEHMPPKIFGQPAIDVTFSFAGPAPAPVPMNFGYARVSTEDQNLDMQLTGLENAGCSIVFTDKISGKTDRRDQFKIMMKRLQDGDTVTVYALSRLYRNAKSLLEIFDNFKARNITLISLTENLNIRSSHGRMAATILAAVDENEVNRVRERTIDGMAERRRQGQVFGRPSKVSPDDAGEMKRLRFKEEVSVPDIAAKFGVSTAAVYQHTNQAKAA